MGRFTLLQSSYWKQFILLHQLLPKSQENTRQKRATSHIIQSKRSFSDFSLVNGKFDFYISSPSKALFDLLYFRTNQFRGVSLENIKLLVEELRIDIDEMDKTEQKKFYENTKNLYERTNTKKFKKQT